MLSFLFNHYFLKIFLLIKSTDISCFFADPLVRGEMALGQSALLKMLQALKKILFFDIFKITVTKTLFIVFMSIWSLFINIT
jgi:hypothetical protein